MLLRGEALHRIAVDHQRTQIDAQRQLVAREDLAQGHREGVVAGLAAQLSTARYEVVLVDHATARAGLIAVASAAPLEQVEGLLVTHHEDPPQR